MLTPSVLILQSTYMYSISKCKLTAVLSIALAGITMVSAVGMNLAQDCGSYCDQREEKPEEDTSPEVALRNSNFRNLQTNLPRTVQRSCTPFSVMELTGSLLALIAGSISWSISSGKFYGQQPVMKWDFFIAKYTPGNSGISGLRSLFFGRGWKGVCKSTELLWFKNKLCRSVLKRNHWNLFATWLVDLWKTYIKLLCVLLKIMLTVFIEPLTE